MLISIEDISSLIKSKLRQIIRLTESSALNTPLGSFLLPGLGSNSQLIKDLNRMIGTDFRDYALMVDVLLPGTFVLFTLLSLHFSLSFYSILFSSITILY